MLLHLPGLRFQMYILSFHPMHQRLLLLISFCYLLGLLKSTAQTTLFFKKITVAQGLNDGAIQAICRDKQGYMWFSTLGGLNRYDGTRFTFFDQITSDTGKVPFSICRSMVSDGAGRLFFGFENGLAQFNFNNKTIYMLPSLGDKWIYDMVVLNDTSLLLNTNAGWIRYNPSTADVYIFKEKSKHNLFRERTGSWCYKNGHLFLCKNDSIFSYNPLTENLVSIILPKAIILSRITHLSLDNKNNLWIVRAGSSSVLRYNLQHNNIDSFPGLLPKEDFGILNIFSPIKENSTWIATTANGLLQYLPEHNKFIRHVHNPLHPWTPNTNLLRAMYFDDDGTTWFGGDYGINYTNPGRTLFEIIPPFDTDITNRNRMIARLTAEDGEGNLWFGTLDGVVKYNPVSKVYKEYNNRPGKKNVIYYNSIRGLTADDDNHLWIATGRGINRLHFLTGKMDFFTEKDSVSQGFYFGTSTDNAGNIWFACRDGAGLYYYQKSDKKFYSIATHKYLRRFFGYGCRYIFQDSKNRYWIGFNGSGLAMYDPKNGQVETWSSISKKQGAIAGDYVVDIKQDKTGSIWVSTFNGLTSIHPETFIIKNYTTSNGLLSNTISSLGIDSLNRIWIGTARGLMLLDKERKFFTSFGEADGLPSAGFPEHVGYQAKNGDLIMPTINGFIRFNPLKFRPGKSKIPCYISQVLAGNDNTPVFIDSTQSIALPHFQNALTIQLTGINFENATQTWYAYKLEGFEKQWHYTQDPKIVYTNLSGGTYRLLYKSGTNAYHWDMPEKTLEIKIGTVFYKTTWFITLGILLLAGLLYWIYRLRLNQQQQVFTLQSKTQSLEKEKAQVMYENLKQHLNPHFLFNSLTSLSSLIKLNQDLAVDFLERMSKIYRYILKNRDSETVTLRDELIFVNNFIELQKTRFENTLLVNVQIDEEHFYKKIVPVTLQNLVENAIKHNTLSKNKPLKIDFFVENDYLVVRNNLQRKNFVETSNKTGLHSMRDLFRYLSSRPLIVEEDEDFFTVRIPLL